MTIKLSIHYHALQDENLVMEIIKPRIQEIALALGKENMWHCDYHPDYQSQEIIFRIKVCGADGDVRREEWVKNPHRLWLDGHSEIINLEDCWRDTPADAVFASSAFTECVNRRLEEGAEVPDIAGSYVEFQLFAPQVRPGEEVAIAGSSDTLGNWEPTSCPTLSDTYFPTWRIRIPSRDLPEEFEYKFIVRDRQTKALKYWEKCGNRKVRITTDDSTATVIAGMRFEEDSMEWQGSGVVIPVFSLRSADGWGIGDFGDLTEMIRWAHSTDQNLLQMLPINDTTKTRNWTDSYPYNAISSFALHPVYIDLRAVDGFDEIEITQQIESERNALNRLDKIDYEKAIRLKEKVLRMLFRHNGKKITAGEEYKIFFNNNSEWLLPYAAFCILRDKYGTADYREWGEFSSYDEMKVEKLASGNKEELDFISYTQFFLHRQLKKASNLANMLGVILKGDIPIGIAHDSVDAWKNPQLFNLDKSAGAPPDDFATDGQNWGFPTYNWEVMRRDGYEWWRARFRHLANYFQAYRIDHILGFFRIWEIPKTQVSGLLGTFSPALPFSAEEMKTRFGFEFNELAHATPVITAPNGIGRYARKDAAGLWHPFKKWRSQVEIINHFGTEAKEGCETIGSRLYHSITNRLFIKDCKKRGYYHPRIEGQKTAVYQALSQQQKLAYDALYNDYFYFRHNSFWAESAMNKLAPLIDETDMLVCGEDLGMIPSCVAPVMKKLNILSLEVQRMPKQYGELWANPMYYPYLSVATTSTHDMPTLRQWMIENRVVAESILRSLNVDPGNEIDSPENCEAILKEHLSGSAMLCVFPWQDWMSIDREARYESAEKEQINNPAKANHYWRYRMHLTIEQLKRNERLRANISELSNR